VGNPLTVERNGKGFNVMLKKLLIAAVAVIAGLVVLTKVTKISPMVWFGDCCRSARNMVPPEVQLKQLKADIDNIDKDIDKNLISLAHMRTDLDNYAEDLARTRDRQAHLFTDIRDMRKSLKDGDEKVVFYRGGKKEADDLTRDLNMTVTEYSCLKEKVKTQEKILAEKRRALETAKTRIAKMKNQQEELRLLAVQLEHELDLLKMKQAENQIADFDDSALSRAQQTAKDVKTRLREIQNLITYKKEFGRTETIQAEPAPNREEVNRKADAILQEDRATKSVSIDKDE
jgi:chromosome segregation ATPase